MGEETVICTRCSREILTKAMKAKDLFFHEDGCFSCSICKKDLRDVSVYAKGGEIYCEGDYKEKFVPKCARCGKYITEACVRAMDRTWHDSCFTCTSCHTKFSSSVGYHEFEDRPLCEDCYIGQVLPKCDGCHRPITERSVKAMGQTWHISCFVCQKCATTFEGNVSFYSVDEKPMCGPCAGVGSE